MTAAALVVVVTALAYASAAPTLGVAEFAPSAQQALAPPPTTGAEAEHGRSAGRPTSTTAPVPSASGQSATTAPAGVPTTKVPRTRTCVGDPPRQIEDPQSPACLATIFEGDNGGATAKGVTGTEIRVTVTTYSDTAGPEFQAAVRTIFDFFNHRFEFYGRRLTPTIVTTDTSSSATAGRATAANLAATQPYAVVDGAHWRNAAFYQELARNQVVSIVPSSKQMLTDRVHLDALHPYIWTAYPSVEQTWAALADFACTSLAGRPARHAGAGLPAATRSFGVVAMGSGRVPWTRPLMDALAACGADARLAEIDGTAAGNADLLRNVVTSFKGSGVTTIMCACADQQLFTVMSAANTASYAPEWLTPTFTVTEADEYIVQVLGPVAQRGRLFGMTPNAKVLPFQAQSWIQPLLAVNAGAAAGAGALLKSAYLIPSVYQGLLMLASGIQGAGPNLTADTMGAGLMTMEFPNTGAGQAPFWQPSVGFGPGDHGFIDDFTLAWWSEAAEAFGAHAAARGSWCYLDRGGRYPVGRFPADADERFFVQSETNPCR